MTATDFHAITPGALAEAERLRTRERMPVYAAVTIGPFEEAGRNIVAQVAATSPLIREYRAALKEAQS